MQDLCDTHEREVCALIPAAGGSRDVMGYMSNYPSALAQVSGTPMIVLIIENLLSMGINNIKLGISWEFREEFSSVIRKFENSSQIELIDVSGSTSPLETIRRISKTLPSNSSLLINLGDTNCKYDFSALRIFESGIVIDSVSENKSWATVSLSPEMQVLEVFEKSTEVHALEAVCGIYWWKNSENFSLKLEQHGDGSELTELLRDYISSGLYAIRAEQWLDSDHSNYRELSSMNLIQSRSFNSLSVNSFTGTITKKSENWEKLVREIEYYENIPEPLKVFFPRMVNFSKDGPYTYQELEYYSYHTLSNLFVYKRIPIHLWKSIMSKLNEILENHFAKVLHDVDQLELRAIFLDRVADRLSILEKSGFFPDALLSSDEVVINGYAYSGIQKILELASPFVDSLNPKVGFIHGDFCLSNILCELNTLNIKLIDPRGGFDTSTCYGPLIYDVAKIGHSVIGGYDFIIADQFRLSQELNAYSQFELELFIAHSHLEIEAEFINTFTNSKISLQELRLLSGLVLLGVPCFHLSHPERAVAMFLRGIQLASDALEKLDANLH